MKALVYHGPGRRAWEERPRPEIQAPTDAIVRMSTTTICGTDLHILKGDVSHKEFWVVDLKTGHERQLTNLGREFAIGDFDVSADAREIIFDRAREESDIVLFDLTDR